MSNTFTGKLLADGQCATGKTAIYTVPVTTTAYVKAISFFNNNATDETVDLFVRKGATSRQIKRFVLSQYDTGVWDIPFPMATGNLIEAKSTTGAIVDFVVFGVEET